MALTPKFHVAEKHLIGLAKRGYLGLMCEANVERTHYLCNLYKPRTCNTGSWEKNEERLHALFACLSAPEVTLAVRELKRKTGKVRNIDTRDTNFKKRKASTSSFQ